MADNQSSLWDGTYPTYQVTYSPMEGQWVATVAQFPSLSWLDDTPAAALHGVMAVVFDTEFGSAD